MTSTVNESSHLSLPVIRVRPKSRIGGGVAKCDGPFATIGYEEFAPETSSMTSVRESVARLLTPLGFDSAQVFACQLIADELATNALLHARSYFSVAISISEQVVRIAVRDESRTYPVLTAAPQGALGGRGISIVAETSNGWGSESLGRGKETWADYPVHAEP